MTRETKIGLLVGLAFIIVIGILLSDHINAAGDPLKADSTQAFNSVENSVRSPNLRQPGATDVVIQPQPVIPQNRVVTESDIEPRQNNGGMMINISPGGDPSKLQIPQRPVAVQGPAAPVDGAAQTNPQQPVTMSEPGAVAASNGQSSPTPGSYISPTDRLAMEARNRNEELVQTNGAPVGISTGPVSLRVEPVAHPEGRQITAEENDTVSKFASKYMGANTKANRDAIIRANPSVGPDGSKVFSGKSYLIPAPAAGSPQPTATASAPPVIIRAAQPQRPVTPAAAATPAPAPAAPTTAMYTVKENDTLWKIASEQLGSGARYAEIQELNRDVLKGNSQVRPNMRLKMPARAVATSN